MSDEPLEQDIWAIGDPRVPQWVRQRALRLGYPPAFVECLGDDEYALFGDDGELVDMVYRTGEDDARK